MPRSRIIDILLIIVLYLGISTFPADLIFNNAYWFYAFEILLMVLCLIFILFYANRKANLNPDGRNTNWKMLLLLLPTSLVALSNFFYAWIMKEPLSPVFDWIDILKVVFLVIVVIIEELIFRKYLLGNLYHENRLIDILISAGAFGLCHLTHFFASFNPLALIDVVYTFALGMLLGFFYIYTHNFYACIGIHLLFNLSNGFLFEHLYGVSNQLWYYLINVFVALLAAIYVLVIYLLKIRKKPVKTGLN